MKWIILVLARIGSVTPELEIKMEIMKKISRMFISQPNEKLDDTVFNSTLEVVANDKKVKEELLNDLRNISKSSNVNERERATKFLLKIAERRYF